MWRKFKVYKYSSKPKSTIKVQKYLLDQECLHHWWLSSHLGDLRCHRGPSFHSMVLVHLWSGMWQFQAVWAGIGTLVMWLGLLMSSWIHKCLSGTGSSNQMSSSSGAVEKSSFFCCSIPERVICAWCRCVVVIHVMLEWWRSFCSSLEWAVNWCTVMS